MLLESEKRRCPRALLLRRPPRHATPRHDAGMSRAELIPTRLFLPVRNGEYVTDKARSETSDHGCYRLGRGPSRRYKHALADPSRHENQITSASRVRSLTAAAAGDSAPFTAYTVDGRAGLRNLASPVPVRERGD